MACQQLLISNWSANISSSNTGPTTFAWRFWYHIFHPHRTGVPESIACLCTIITTHHPPPTTLPTLVYRVTFVTWHWIPGSPTFLMYIEKIVEPGDKANLVAIAIFPDRGAPCVIWHPKIPPRPANGNPSLLQTKRNFKIRPMVYIWKKSRSITVWGLLRLAPITCTCKLPIRWFSRKMKVNLRGRYRSLLRGCL